jgi:hypothetical protein
MELTFLSAASGKPIIKTFDEGNTQSYPNVAMFNSYTHNVPQTLEGMAELTGFMQTAADKGHCLLKGPLLSKLTEERRKGKTDKDAATRLLVLDIDGVSLKGMDTPSKISSETLQMLNGMLISLLPDYFHNLSHILQASASLGRKKESISMHLYFFIDEDVHPRILKDYLMDLNLDGGFFEDQLTMTATGLGLRYGVDRSLADNSRLIYLGTPNFIGEDNPFGNDQDRIMFIQKENLLLDADNILGTSAATVAKKNLDKLNKLRIAKGMTKKNKIKLDFIMEDGERIAVLNDPDQARMLVSVDEGDFVRYNMNGGDSNAYWVFKYSPEIVHNFKGEPCVRFKDVDPEGYQEHKMNFQDETTKKEVDWAQAPFAFIDWHAQPYWGLVQSDTDEIIKLEACKREAIRDLYAQYSISSPENLPVFDYSFRPRDDRQFDREGKFINKYRMPKIMAEPVDIGEEYKGATIGTFAEHQALFPTIYKLLFSVCGCGGIGGSSGIVGNSVQGLGANADGAGPEQPDAGTTEELEGTRELEYFINWLAFIVQERKKALTAWVFHGTQGTGKGLLFDQVIMPILGDEYAMMKRTQDLDDFFNGYMERTLLIAVDEFRTEGKGVKTDLTNKLKNMITEVKGTVRAMRTDQYSVDLYTNFIFFSNDKDAVRIPGDDRRFNVAPRQEIPILKRFPTIVADIEKNIVGERERFCRYLLEYNYDEQFVATPLVNKAKEEMREASATSIDLFVEAIHEGNLDYFLAVMDEHPRSSGEDYVSSAQLMIKSQLRNYEQGTESRIWMTELRPLYNVLISRCDNIVKLGKILRHHNLESEKLRKGGQTRAGFKVCWNLRDHDINFLRETYLSTEEMKLVPNNPHAPKEVDKGHENNIIEWSPKMR